MLKRVLYALSYIILFFVILRKYYQATKLENYLDMPYFLRLIFARFAEKGKNYVFARVRRGLFCPFAEHKKPRPKAWLQLYFISYFVWVAGADSDPFSDMSMSLYAGVRCRLPSANEQRWHPFAGAMIAVPRGRNRIFGVVYRLDCEQHTTLCPYRDRCPCRTSPTRASSA